MSDTKERLDLIKKIEDIRGSKVICYLTSLRSNVSGAQMADDAVRVIFDHLLLLQSRPIEKVDLFLCSNGGSTTVPWRLVSLLREFAKSFNVIIPYRAYSAATLLALGADEIIMHPFAELGPIDPQVANEFNPPDAQNNRLGINVEDVSAYVNFIKNTVGITHEDELVEMIKILAEKVHPLALGNVERFLSQSRMIAKKILRTHMKEADEHTINDIVENMTSKLYFHGHPINRKEAIDELCLKVTSDLQPALESAMWELYTQYEDDFQNRTAFNPVGELLEQIMPGQALPSPTIHEILLTLIESERMTSKQVNRLRYQALLAGPAQAPQVMFQPLSLQWEHAQRPAQE